MPSQYRSMSLQFSEALPVSWLALTVRRFALTVSKYVLTVCNALPVSWLALTVRRFDLTITKCVLTVSQCGPSFMVCLYSFGDAPTRSDTFAVHSLSN